MAGDNRIAPFVLKFARANFSNARLRNRSGFRTRFFPLSSTSKSKTIKIAGCAAASFCTRLAAGWSRNCNSSKESAPPIGITSSPSTTKFLRFQFREPLRPRPENNERAVGRISIAEKSFSPSRKARQRKPSHFGSYCQSSPTGISSTERASIGGNGGLIGRAMNQDACAPNQSVILSEAKNLTNSVYVRSLATPG